MNRKIFYLLTALALPVLIFIFLKLFGKNQFDIPVYYKDSLPKLSTECNETIRPPYFLPDSLLMAIQWDEDVMLLLSGATDEEQIELNRLVKEAKLDGLQVISLDNIEASRLQRWKSCVLFLKEPWKAVLVDNKKQIRGYYALNTLEEIDRLGVELEILLKRY